jgi:vacuolar-type H+-ATPase subunit C/Vma6
MYKYDFLQAKLHGIHSKSIVGDNFNKLKNIKSIDTLKKHLFPDDNSIISERNLYGYLEKDFKIKIFKQINYVSKFFNYKNPFINNMILRYEIDNVKLLVNTFLSSGKKIEEMFEVDLKDTLNYQLIYDSDISDKANIKLILNDTLFKFIIPMIEENKDLFCIENELDKFYYNSLLDSLKSLRKYESEILKKIIIFEMNWQNITWAFRVKLYYKKSFANIKDSFLRYQGLIKPDVLEKIFQLEFVPDEAKKMFSGYPPKYQEIILKSFDENGDFDLILLEENVMEELMKLYTKYFFIENFNILPLISFIYIKKNEYFNIVRLIESIRYNLPLEKSA